MKNQHISLIFGLMAIIIYCSCTQNQTGLASVAVHEHSSMDKHTINRYAEKVNSGQIKPDTMKGSPPRNAMALISGTHIHISYQSPGVKGRTIWGGLVAYDAVWAAGAHHPTKISFSSAVTINNAYVPKGEYALFIIPGRENWTVILNKDFNQHMADNYNEKLDILRVKVNPQPNIQVQRLTYTVTEVNKNEGAILFDWEKVRLTVPFFLSR